MKISAATIFWTLLATLVLAGSAAAGGVEPEPLTLRVHDATAVPNGIAAVVLRTYAARPIRQGQVCLAARRLLRQPTPVVKKGMPGQPVNRGTSAVPFAALLGAAVFSDANDAVEQLQFLEGELDQITMLEFDSPSASVNMSDGPLMVLYYRMRGDVAPGDEYEIEVDLANTALVDPDQQPLLVDARNGRLRIRAPSDPVDVSAAAEAPDVSNTVMVSMQTHEPIAIASGQLGLRYSQGLMPELPKIRIDPRHGNGQRDVVYTRDLIVVQFWSPDNSLNTVPGDIVSFYFEIDMNADPGIDRSVWLDPAFTYFYDLNGTAVTLGLEGDVIP
ncbi:MAG: hypothetical protein OEQ74_03900 [Gammaproteobacteria bacterium]|nr:hypothetical protein [Gammaproteobacteria bacterium]